jgi:S1-C subfamily serine protease
MPGSIAEGLWRMTCAVSAPQHDKPYLEDLAAGDWLDMGRSADGSFEQYLQRSGIVRLDKDHVIVLSRSDYATLKTVDGVPVRYVLTAALVDCAGLKWASVGGDFYATPKLRVRSMRKEPADLQPETIAPGSFLYANLKTVCAPDAGTPVKGGEDPGFSIGTAWGVEKGYLVTASHVVEGGDTILVYRNGERVGEAKVVADDPANDLAVLKVTLAKTARLSVLPLAARPPPLGRRVFTLGYPAPEILGQHVKMTSGEVSSTTGGGDDARYLQISVPLQPGNSGGPVLAWDGVVVGVAQSVLKTFGDDGDEPAPQMVNYAVKVSYLRPLLEDLPTLGKAMVVHAAGDPEAVVAQVRAAVYMVVVAKGGEN